MEYQKAINFLNNAFNQPSNYLSLGQKVVLE